MPVPNPAQSQSTFFFRDNLQQVLQNGLRPTSPADSSDAGSNEESNLGDSSDTASNPDDNCIELLANTLWQKAKLPEGKPNSIPPKDC